MHRDFILGASQRKPDAILSCHQRTARQLPENFRQFLTAQLAVTIVAFRQTLTGRYKHHRSSAFAADLLQHGEVVSGTDPEVLGDNLAFALFWQNAGKEPLAFPAAESLFSKRQGVRQWNCLCIGQPAFDITERHLTVLILSELASQMPTQVNIQRPRHS